MAGLVICRLRFKTAVHFGSGRLTVANITFYADTLFSALCHEAVKQYGSDGAELLFRLADRGELMLSDGMLYQGDTLLIPKPIVHIEGNRESDSSLKKQFKKLKYIPTDHIDGFLSGEYNPVAALDIELGRVGSRDMVKVRENEASRFFRIGTYTFAEDCGLYFIARTATDEAEDLLKRLTTSLSSTGIGGKVSVGLGKFDCTFSTLPVDLERRLNEKSSLYMSLSLSMASDSELEDAVNGASYEMIKRSGFVASERYSPTPLKKAEFYCFKGGSCFTNRFNGGVFDVSREGAHPVYRYAKPMLMAIGKEG